MAKATVSMIDDNNAVKVIEYEISAETHWEAVDYYIPCNGCDKLVFHSTTEIRGNHYMCPICAEKSKIDLDAITSKAEDTFWEVVAASLPETKTGDLSMSMTIRLSDLMKEAVQEWYNNNKLPDPPAEVMLYPYKEFNELELHFSKEWEIEQTGGNVFVAYLLFYAHDGEARRLGVSSECICIIDKPWTQEQDEAYAWFFGDNPTAFFCAMEDLAIHTDKFDFGKLFDDCQTIAKSGLV